MKSILIPIVIATLFFGCEGGPETPSIPKCLESVPESAFQFEPTIPRANIKKYIYKGEEVFIINIMNFPDGQSVVVSTECVSICTLGGFFGDNSPRACKDWNDDTVEFIEVIWTDPR